VYGLGSTVPTRSNAEYAAVDWRALARKPIDASFEEAAAWPLVGLTAWEMVVEELELKSGSGALLVINGKIIKLSSKCIIRREADYLVFLLAKFRCWRSWIDLNPNCQTLCWSENNYCHCIQTRNVHPFYFYILAPKFEYNPCISRIEHVLNMGATHTISHREPLVPQINVLGLSEPVKYIAVLTSITSDLLAQVIQSDLHL